MEVTINDWQVEVLRGLLAEVLGTNEHYDVLESLYNQLTTEEN